MTLNHIVTLTILCNSELGYTINYSLTSACINLTLSQLGAEIPGESQIHQTKP